MFTNVEKYISLRINKSTQCTLSSNLYTVVIIFLYDVIIQRTEDELHMGTILFEKNSTGDGNISTQNKTKGFVRKYPVTNTWQDTRDTWQNSGTYTHI